MTRYRRLRNVGLVGIELGSSSKEVSNLALFFIVNGTGFKAIPGGLYNLSGPTLDAYASILKFYKLN